MIRFVYPAALAVLTLLVACSGGGDSNASPTPTASQTSTPASATPTAGSSATDGAGAVTTLPIGDPIAMPQGVVMIVEAGCFQCDGPGSGLFRVFKLADGKTVVQQLFSAGQRYFPDNFEAVFEANGVVIPTTRVATVGGTISEEEPYITGWAVSDDGDTLIAGVCVQGFCGGSLIGLSDNAQTILYQSVDGGITWSELAAVDAGVWVVDVDLRGRALVAQWTNPDPNIPASFFFEPGHEPVLRPHVVPERTFPTVDGEQVVWGSAGTWYLPDGSIVLNIPGEQSDSGLMYGGTTGPVAMFVDGPEANLEVYDGKSDSFERFSVPEMWSIAGWAAGPQLFGNISLSMEGQLASLPAILYDKNKFISPITDPFLGSDFEKGRNRVIAVQIHPAAVVSGTGSCLNVRDDPSVESAILDCVPDGVILHVVGPDQGNGWLHVTSPTGAKGYVSADFLDIIALPPNQD